MLHITHLPIVPGHRWTLCHSCDSALSSSPKMNQNAVPHYIPKKQKAAKGATADPHLVHVMLDGSVSPAQTLVLDCWSL